MDQTIFSDITILLAMVVFMDQLSAQTPPMKDNVPVIGQVCSSFFIAILQIFFYGGIFLVFCGIAYYNLMLNDQHNLLSPSSPYGRSTCFAIMVKIFRRGF